MISAIFTQVGSVITAFAGILTNGVSSVVSLFWTTGSGGTGALTEVGQLLLIPFGIGLVIAVYHLIKGLIRVR